MWADRYEGDPQNTPFLRQTDLTPEKLGTDVTFLGRSFAPGGAAGAWACRLALGPIDKTLHVSGPRRWQPVMRGRFSRALSKQGPISDWSLSEPEPVDEVPVDWRLAYGGVTPGSGAGGAPAVDPRNPVGCGIIGPVETWTEADRPAPQILTRPDLTWQDTPEPAGLGPIPPFWRQRQQYAGTYDDAWSENRHPLLPLDFNVRFWQAAPADQIAVPHLTGGETYTLENLHPGHAVATGRLPVVTLAVHCDPGGGGRAGWHVMALDGVQFDWREDDRILLTWRVRFPLPEAATAVLRLQRVTPAVQAPRSPAEAAQ